MRDGWIEASALSDSTARVNQTPSLSYDQDLKSTSTNPSRASPNSPPTRWKAFGSRVNHRRLDFIRGGRHLEQQYWRPLEHSRKLARLKYCRRRRQHGEFRLARSR